QPRLLGAAAVPRARGGRAPVSRRPGPGGRPPPRGGTVCGAGGGAPRQGAEEPPEPSDAYLEEVFLRLRILEGVPTSWVEPEKAAPFVESGLLRDRDGALVPTERGMLVLNELVLALTA